MDRRSEQATRDRAIWAVRLATFGGVAGALGLTWLFSILAAMFFSGKPVAAQAPPAPPKVPVAAAPVQAAPTVIQTVVHHPYSGRYTAPAASAPQPPGQAPAPAPPPPPPPVCHSTPSKPC